MPSNSENQAKAQLESIIEMVDRVKRARNYDKREEAIDLIMNDPLEIATRSGWVSTTDDMHPEEYMILLCTGGPAVKIVGDINDYGEPETAHLFHQDWGTPWIEYRVDREQEDYLMEYARNFYFGKD